MRRFLHNVSVEPSAEGLQNAALWWREATSSKCGTWLSKAACPKWADDIVQAILTAITPFLENQAHKAVRASRQSIEYADAFQIARLGAIRALSTWDPSKGRFWTWCYTCVRSDLRGMLRKQESTPVTLDLPLDLPQEPSGLDVETSLDLRRALSRLPQLTRTVVELRILEERTVGQVANELGLSLQQVRELHKQGLQQLHSYLSSDAADRDLLPESPH